MFIIIYVFNVLIMRKFFYVFSVTLFLSFLVFHIGVSFNNPFYGVSMEALAYGSGGGGSRDCFYPDEYYAPVVSCGINEGCCWEKIDEKSCKIGRASCRGRMMGWE